jgi:hypothetical protein
MPVALFSARLLGGPSTVVGFRAQYDVPVDEEASSPALTVVLNWATGMRR